MWQLIGLACVLHALEGEPKPVLVCNRVEFERYPTEMLCRKMEGMVQDKLQDDEKTKDSFVACVKEEEKPSY